MPKKFLVTMMVQRSVWYVVEADNDKEAMREAVEAAKANKRAYLTKPWRYCVTLVGDMDPKKGF
ncbi:hypothetical protein [Streptomyces sp. CBMA156]|uniref:hypothetical protein n=1 Tax=Streptomyces sp. CBMA156 TaxID=1930280 RepID=UPI001661C6F5|nr:hypothetical protein [Streptomyces sp. CBMA156]